MPGFFATLRMTFVVWYDAAPPPDGRPNLRKALPFRERQRSNRLGRGCASPPGVSTLHTPFPGCSGSRFIAPYQLVMSLRDTHEAMKALGVGAGFKPAPTQFSRQGMTSVMPQRVADSNGFSRWPAQPGAKHASRKGHFVMLSKAKHLCIALETNAWILRYIQNDSR